MKKKAIAAILAACVCVRMLAGCGGSSASNTPAAAPAEGAEGKIINSL